MRMPSVTSSSDARSVAAARDLTPAQTLFEPRRSLLDLRVSKVFSIGPWKRLRANLDVYNALNDGSILTINNNYGQE